MKNTRINGFVSLFRVNIKQILLIIVLSTITFMYISCAQDNSTDPNIDNSNSSPVIKKIIPDSQFVQVGGIQNINCQASDIDGDSLSYLWSCSAGTISNESSYISWNAPDTTCLAIIKCKVSDKEFSDIDSIKIYVNSRMIFVEHGSFIMGDHYNEGLSLELPKHAVNISDFYISENEVTQAEWLHLFPNWPLEPTQGIGDNYPIKASRYWILKYCNLRSVFEGLTPCYSINGTTNPSNWGDVPNNENKTWNEAQCNWNNNGYRLPTEAEWEYAARGGVYNNDDYRYSGGNNIDEIAWYSNNSLSGFRPVKQKSSNQLGLFDMSGNWTEHVWDWFRNEYYQNCLDEEVVTNPTGPEIPDQATGWTVIIRGGNWASDAVDCRVSSRDTKYPFGNAGFRVVKSNRLIPFNNPPKIIEILPELWIIEPSTSLSIICNATDPENDHINYNWDVSEGYLNVNDSIINWQSPDSTCLVTFKCTVSDWEFSYIDSIKILVTNEMIYINGGTFEMGDFLDANEDELPVHSVSIGDYYIGATEVTQYQWEQYIEPVTYYYGTADYYPIYALSWYKVLKYCNLRSISEGLTPCYTINNSTDPIDWGNIPVNQNAQWDSVLCDWNSNGYRLPTEAEWEYAARGGLVGKRFPSGLTISHSNNGDEQANYYASKVYDFDISPSEGEHPDFDGIVSPVGSFKPNGYGLYDISGNVYEWCWDWYDGNYYTMCANQALTSNPNGPLKGEQRVRRGGYWKFNAYYTRVSDRSYNSEPNSGSFYTGFRLARTF